MDKFISMQQLDFVQLFNSHMLFYRIRKYFILAYSFDHLELNIHSQQCIYGAQNV